MKNLSSIEMVLRITVGLVLVAVSVHYIIWFFGVMGLWFVYTGAFRYCPLYSVSGFNEKEAKENFYLSQLPRYNSEPVYVFNASGDLRFRNKAAEKILPNLTSVSELVDSRGQNIQQTLEKEESFFERFEEKGLSYLVRFRAVKEIDTILAYAFNITEIVRINEEILNTQKELVYRMGEIGETRSRETGNHVKRVAEFSYCLAKLYGMNEEEAEILKTASPMHDIGKVAIPDSILKKPGRLDDDEWEIMKTHALVGYELLCRSDRPILKAAAIVAGEHHEKWDGSGYPNGKRQEDIHIYGRITAIADVFDALGSDRVYKKAWPIEEVWAYFKRESSVHFDPELVEVFLSHREQFFAIQEAYKG